MHFFRTVGVYLRVSLVLGLLLGLTGCATWGPGGVPHKSPLGFTLTVPAGWIFHPSVGGELFATRDGVALQQFTVRRGELPLDLPMTKREVKAGMTAYELAEMLTDEDRAEKQRERYTVTATAATQLGGLEGCRFDFSHRTPDGLRMSGRVWAVMRGEYLYVLRYAAPSRHYYERDLAAVTSAVEGLKFVP
jgi:hypothetical protein